MGNMTGIFPTVDQIESLHRKLAPSDAGYDLIHTHCVIIAQITRQLIHRLTAVFMRRCTLPADAPERTGAPAPGAFAVPATDGVTGGTVPPRYLDAGQAVLGALLHDIGTYRVLKNDTCSTG